MTDKYHEAILASNVTEDDAQVQAAVEKILAEHLEENMKPGGIPIAFSTP